MIYDRDLWWCQLAPGSGGVTQARVTKRKHFLFAEREVYHRRYWEAVQANSRIDTMVELPLHRPIAATDYVLLDDGSLYRVEQSQHSTDRDGLPITVLSLRRYGGNYDVGKPD